jgi:hypothetical protein
MATRIIYDLKEKSLSLGPSSEKKRRKILSLVLLKEDWLVMVFLRYMSDLISL